MGTLAHDNHYALSVCLVVWLGCAHDKDLRDANTGLSGAYSMIVSIVHDSRVIGEQVGNGI